MAEQARSGERDGEPGPGDGRVRRGARNRERILDAVLALVEEGHLQPTAEQVAVHAGVGTRTVFRHFADMETLLGEMHQRVLQRIAVPGIRLPEDGLSLPDRVADLVRRRADVFERVAPFKRSADSIRWRSPFLQRQHGQMLKALRRDLLERLPELGELAPAAVEAAELLTSFEAWNRLRADQHLGRGRAMAAIEQGLADLLSARTSAADRHAPRRG